MAKAHDLQVLGVLVRRIGGALPDLSALRVLRSSRQLTVLAVLFAIVLIALPSAGAAGRFTGKVIGVADGDTIEVLRDHRPVRLRLNGVDAPEDGQAFGTRARQFVASLVFGQTVTVIEHGSDPYDRTIADVVLSDGRVLNREVVRAGFAWWFRQYSTDQSIGALEEEARAAKRGLWADPRPMPPWEWRRAKRDEPRVSGSAPAGTPPPAVAGPIIGNTRSGIYHRPDCPNYADVAVGNRVPFGSAAEAEAAGYRLAKNCP
jgi:endonuclease YncB( thermonuclease family)